MSGRSGSTRHHHRSSRTMASDYEDIITQVKNAVTTLYDVAASRPYDCQSYIPSARSAMTNLDNIRFFQDTNRFAEQVWILQGLQQFTYHDADHGAIVDIADYTQACWLILLDHFPNNETVLTGLGRNWLQRSQATLARIQREETNDYSNGGSSSQSGHSLPLSDEEAGSSNLLTASSNDPRRQGALYLEARGYLQPAVDFYRRAINAADYNNTTTGELLASAAEAYMSLGNVTASPADEELFTQALRYLRRAEAMPGYILSVYLQQYLNEYGRYVT